jgi:cbb3-type cytochrome oxidase maturation protein
VILIAASLLVAVSFLIAFLWAVRSGQYKDTYTPSIRILFDEDKNSSDKEK